MAISLLTSVFRNTGSNSRCVCSSYSIFYRNQSHHRKKIFKREETKQIRSFIVDRYYAFVKKYDTALEKRFPTAMQIYRTFVNGCHDFFKDLKSFVTIYRELNKNGFKNLQRNDIELYYKMRQDMKKVAPVLIVSTLPMANYFIFPLIYMYPKQLLTSHFWSLQQKSEFGIFFLRERLLYQKPVFRCVQQAFVKIPKDNPSHCIWKKILGVIGSGCSPSLEDILRCRELFCTKPYSLNDITGKHAAKLLRLHGLKPSLFFKRSLLAYRARLLKEMDLALVREGGLEKLTSEELRHVSQIRGLNPANMSNCELTEYLEQWLQLSNATDRDTYSLLLHAPILLAYNHPNNWVLIY